MIKPLYKVIEYFWGEKYEVGFDVEASRNQLIFYIILISFFFLIPFAFFALYLEQYNIALNNVLVVIVIIILLYYYKYSKNTYVFNAVSVATFGILFLYLIYINLGDSSGPLWSFVFTVSAFFMLGRKRTMLYMSIFLFIAILIFIFNPNNLNYSLAFKVRFIASQIAVSTVAFYIEYIRELMHKKLVESNKNQERTINLLKEQEKLILEKESHYRTLFEASNDGILILDNDIIKECNPKSIKLFDTDRESLIGASVIELSPLLQADGKLSQEKIRQNIKKALKGESKIFEWIHLKKTGEEFFADISLNSMEVNGKKLVLASLRDTTNKKLFEQKLLEAKESAEKSDKLKSEFLAQMSHEIRTPINTILNHSSLVKFELEENSNFNNQLNESFISIETAASRLIRTIDLILNISDIEAGTYEPNFEDIDIIDTIIVPIVKEFKKTAFNKNILLSYYCYLQNNPIIKIDSYTLYQTVANLVDNAIKYTDKGKIIIEVSKEDKNHLLKVKDTGIGISEEFLPKLFSKFSQEEVGYTRKFEGNGLGLALVKNYCNINGINISVESKKGEGTTFILEIPNTVEK